MNVKQLFNYFATTKTDIPVKMKGWCKTNRTNGQIGFIEFNDGSYFKNVQLVYDNESDNFKIIENILTYTPIEVEGIAIYTAGGKQDFEIKVKHIEILGTNVENYPLQKKRHSLEFLREIAHLRPRTNTFQAMFRVRSVLIFTLHKFFQERGFINVHTPIITSNDAEGAGECFVVSTKNEKELFFSKPASLTVSGQLNGEAFALAFGKIYTFGPTFRAEKSNTPRHGAEFWMLEPEVAFADLSDNMDLIEEMTKYCIEEIITQCPLEIQFFNDFYDKTLLERLNHVKASPFARLTYTKAIEILLEALAQNKSKFIYDKIVWGMDLQSEHERYIAEQVIKGPVFITDYPKQIKAFYMKQNDDRKTVAACDLLVPKIGELVGGSQRETDYHKLLSLMEEKGMKKDGLEWYLDLRLFGGVQHSGFGLGFDRLLMYLTGIENIRDVIPFPRTFGNLEF
jgi:asparaginyl-tRNA synthetase